MTVHVVRKSVLQKNDRAAALNRERLDATGIRAVNILGGAGCGKTTLLEAIVPRLLPSLRVGVLEGDIATTRDADRIAALCVPVAQLLTEGGCHLTATLVERGLDLLPLENIDLLIIENVGNPICPANFDLGEHRRLAVLSVTEGHDKPQKYPHLFQVAHAVAITKCDLLGATDFDLDAADHALASLCPQATVFHVSTRRPETLEGIVNWFRKEPSGTSFQSAPVIVSSTT